MHHGSETFHIEGEGIVGQQAGGRSGEAPDPVTESAEATAAGPHAAGRRRGAAVPVLARRAEGDADRSRPDQEGRAGDDLGRWRQRRRAGGLHLPRPVRRPRPHLGPHQTSCWATTSPPPSSCRVARRGSTSTPCTASGPANPGSARFYAADGLHLKVGNSRRVGNDAKKTGHDLPRKDGERTAAHPRPPQRREPHRGPDPRGDDPLPQRRRRRVARVGAGGAAVPRGPQEGDAALPVAGAPRLPAADRRPGGPRRRVHQRPGAGRARRGAHRRPDDAGRVLDRGLPARPQHDPQPPTTGTGASPGRPAAWSTCSTSPVSAAPSAATSSLVSNWLADWRRMYDFTAGGHPELAPPSDNVNLAKRIDTLLTDPLKNLPPSTFGGPGHDPVRRRTPQPGLPQPHPGQDGQARHRARRWPRSSPTRASPVAALTRNQILHGDGGAVLAGLDAAQKDALVDKTPLWFYVLREAETQRRPAQRRRRPPRRRDLPPGHGGQPLLPRAQPGFLPDLGRGTIFEMTDLLLVAFDNQALGPQPPRRRLTVSSPRQVGVRWLPGNQLSTRPPAQPQSPSSSPPIRTMKAETTTMKNTRTKRRPDSPPCGRRGSRRPGWSRPSSGPTPEHVAVRHEDAQRAEVGGPLARRALADASRKS